MNVEELRSYCLSLSPNVEEKFPFPKFKAARDVLAFYIDGHMFCYFNINDLSCITVKHEKEEIPDLIEHYPCLGHKILNHRIKIQGKLNPTKNRKRAAHPIIGVAVRFSFHKFSSSG